MNRFFAVLGVALVVVVAFADTKVGYIDSGRILQEYEGMESVRKQLDQEQTEWESTAEELLKELEDMRSELDTQRPMLTADALKDKEKAIRDKQREYEEFLQRIWGPDGQAAQTNVELTRPLIDKVNTVLEELAEADGYSMIFDIVEGGVVYARDGLDLTDLVLDELNKEFAPIAGEEEEEREEIKIAIFRFAENTLAEEEKSADRVFQSIYTLLDQSVRYEAIPRDRIDNLVAGMGLERERSIPQDRAVEIAQSAGAEVLLLGEINKTIVHLEVTAKLVDADAGVLLLSETRKAEGETEEAFQTLMSDIASAVIQRYRP